VAGYCEGKGNLMTDKADVSYEDSVALALDTALYVEAAYQSVLAANGIHEDDLEMLAKQVRELIRGYVDAADEPADG
jgi:hypothetical protein